MPMIKLDNITITYNAHPVVHHVTAHIQQGDLVAVIGPNGSGKSSLLNAIAGLTPINSGAITTHQSNTAYLAQKNKLDDSFPITVYELVRLGLFSRFGWFRRLGSHQKIVKYAIKQVGLSGFENRLINTLSGGQLQRALFARIIVQDQPIIVLDEPFSAIDTASVQNLIAILLQWQKCGKTILVATHDLTQVQQYFPTTLYLARELLAFGATPTVLTPKNQLKAKNLSEAFDENASICHV